MVETLANDLQVEFPGIGGFSAANLWRMRLSYSLYAGDVKLAPMVREIGWMHNLLTHQIENKTIAEYALRESTKPIGVASYRVVSTLHQELRGQLSARDQVSKLLEEL